MVYREGQSNEQEGNQEQTLEQAVALALDAVENNESPAPEAVQSAKKWWSFKGEGPAVWGATKDTARFGCGATSVGISIVWNIAKSLFRFSKDLATGKMKFGKGVEDAEEIFSFGAKKEKNKG